MDPEGNVIPGATIRLLCLADSSRHATVPDSQGQFFFTNLSSGEYDLSAEFHGFAPVKRTVALADKQNRTEKIQMLAFSSQNESVTVTANLNEIDILAPDPGRTRLCESRFA